LGGGGGEELVEDIGVELVEFGLIFVGHDGWGRAEAVSGGVGSGLGFAFRGAGTGGSGSVGLVGCELGWR